MNGSNEKKPANTSDLMKDMTQSFKSTFLKDWYSTLFGFLSGSKAFYIVLAIGIVVIYIGAMAGFFSFEPFNVMPPQ